MKKITLALVYLFFLNYITQAQATKNGFYQILEQANLAGKNYVSCLNNTANNTPVWERL